jgi:hypothetical protein
MRIDAPIDSRSTAAERQCREGKKLQIAEKGRTNCSPRAFDSRAQSDFLRQINRVEFQGSIWTNGKCHRSGQVNVNAYSPRASFCAQFNHA